MRRLRLLAALALLSASFLGASPASAGGAGAWCTDSLGHRLPCSVATDGGGSSGGPIGNPGHHGSPSPYYWKMTSIEHATTQAEWTAITLVLIPRYNLPRCFDPFDAQTNSIAETDELLSRADPSALPLKVQLSCYGPGGGAAGPPALPDPTVVWSTGSQDVWVPGVVIQPSTGRVLVSSTVTFDVSGTIGRVTVPSATAGGCTVATWADPQSYNWFIDYAESPHVIDFPNSPKWSFPGYDKRGTHDAVLVVIWDGHYTIDCGAGPSAPVDFGTQPFASPTTTFTVSEVRSLLQ